jgi:hypothetical protein
MQSEGSASLLKFVSDLQLGRENPKQRDGDA